MRMATRGSLLMSLSLTLAACGSGEPPAPPARPILVEAPQLFSQSGEVFPGSVRAREEADLAFRVPGKILLRKADAGDRIKAGETLATLDPEDATLNLKAAEASALAAEADMKLAESELTRHKDLLEKGFISKSLYDVRENTFRLAQARNEQAQSSLAVVRNQSRYTTLSADKAGLVTAVLAEAGQVVAAGQPVFRFATDSSREVIFHVPEGRLDALRKADKLSVTLWSQADKVYAAKLAEVNLQADRSTRTHEARVVLIDAGEEVPLGSTATVLLGAKVDAALFSIPLTALGAVGGQAVVWIVGDDQKVHAQPVQVVRYLEHAVIVAGALKPSMKMVSAGTQLMVEGMAATQVIQRQREAGAPAGSHP